MIVQNSRAYVRPTRYSSAASQIAACETVASDIGVPVVLYVEGEHSRDAWVRALRADEVGIIADLTLLARPREPGVRPSADLAETVLAAQARAYFLVDAKTGIRSTDKRWPAAVGEASAAVARGRKLVPDEARRMAKIARARAEPGVVARWRARSMADKRAQWAAVWRDAQYPSAQAAFDAMPPELQEEFGSLDTARRVFGRRHPRKGFGRPKKQET